MYTNSVGALNDSEPKLVKYLSNFQCFAKCSINKNKICFPYIVNNSPACYTDSVARNYSACLSSTHAPPLGPFLRWRTELIVPQFKKTHASRRNSSKFKTHLYQFDNTCPEKSAQLTYTLAAAQLTRSVAVCACCEIEF